MCGLRTRPWMDVDPPAIFATVELPSVRGGAYRLTSCTVTNLFIMNLAVADLVIIVVCLPSVSFPAEVPYTSPAFYTTERLRDSYM